MATVLLVKAELEAVQCGGNNPAPLNSDSAETVTETDAIFSLATQPPG
jgi:hypothetical protein